MKGMNKSYQAINFQKLSKQQNYLLMLFLCLSAVPHFFHLTFAITLFFISIIMFRLIIISISGKGHPRWMNYIFLITGIIIVITEYSGVIGKDFGVSLLVSMLSLKVLEIKLYRDAYVMLLLTGFMLVTHFLYNQEIYIVVYVFSLAFLILFFFLWFNQLNSKSFPLNRVLTVLKLSAQAIPVMIILFIFFPRLDGPLWGFNQESGTAITGISGNISPGSISQLSKSSAIAFRVKFDDNAEIPEPEQRYWRGPVIINTNGVDWNAEQQPTAATISYRAIGNEVKYQIISEPSNQHWIFALDLPSNIPEEAFITKTYSVRSTDKIQKRTIFNLVSNPEYIANISSPVELQNSLVLPPTISQRMRDLAHTLGANIVADEFFVQAVLNHFYTENFIYTLNPPILSDNPADEFLFESRKGFCEHYATSFVLLMRIAGIPARVVAGYQGGEWNTAGNHLIVRQSDAHAWSEVWLENKGWTRIDPTSAVAPERIEHSIDPDQFIEGAPAVFKIDSEGFFGQVFTQAFYLADTLDLNWHRWVVGFSKQRQEYFLRSSGMDFLQGYKLGMGAIIFSSLAIIMVIFLFREKIKDHRDPAKKTWDKFVTKLKRKGVGCNPQDGPLTISQKASQTLAHKKSSIQLISALYIKIRYSKIHSEEQIKTLRRLVSEFK